MKLIGYTCTFNEAEYVPYVMPFVEKMGYDKFVVYDNGSTDNTVELLSKYPFVEIRHYNTNGIFNDNAKMETQINSYLECFSEAKVNTVEEEDIFMTFTDFDEVYFFQNYRGRTFKEQLKIFLECGKNFNYLDKPMINLLLPKNLASICEPSKIMNIEGIRGCAWDMGHKPSLIKVNDFYSIFTTAGNHTMWGKLREGKEKISIDESMLVYTFHLKYINKDILQNKTFAYTKRNAYSTEYANLDAIFENLYQMSFPLEQYFLQEMIRFNKNKQGLYA